MQILSPENISSSKNEGQVGSHGLSSCFCWSRKSTFCPTRFRIPYIPLNPRKKVRYKNRCLGGFAAGCCSSVHCLKLDPQQEGAKNLVGPKPAPPTFGEEVNVANKITHFWPAGLFVVVVFQKYPIGRISWITMEHVPIYLPYIYGEMAWELYRSSHGSIWDWTTVWDVFPGVKVFFFDFLGRHWCTDAERNSLKSSTNNRKMVKNQLLIKPTVDGQNPAPPRMMNIPLFIGF